MHDLAEVNTVLQQVSQRSNCERDTTDDAPVPINAPLRAITIPGKLLGNGTEREQCCIALKDVPDLLFRLNVLNIYTPPLCERREDIPKLAASFVARSAVRIGRPCLSLSECAIERLQAADWPGNVRELENVIFRSASLADSPVLTAGHLVFNDEDRNTARPGPAGAFARYKEAFEAFEHRYFANVAKTARTARSVAALTGLSTATAARKLRKHRQD
ncbi:hypothetical protein PE061_09930 [Sphingosinicella microcystinivorans]|nr:hypothetical protein [Sphingosinicella microcystinivorans]WBX86201.1 hypothetical protein PE061_09930 [Sphingosinicella microcystinivorans]